MSRIRVNPADRQREDVGDLEDLAVSIEKFGQLQPIIIDDEYNLVSGFRRLSAFAALGRDKIRAEFVGHLTILRAKEIELEENIRRKQLEWQEEQKAIAELHRLKKEEDPTWSAEKTAEMVGRSRRSIFNALELDRAATENVAEINKAKTAAGAMLRLKKHKQIEARKEEAKIRVRREELGLVRKVDVMVVHDDARKYMATMPAESVDLVITNPPYGVSIEQLFIGDQTIYSDEEKEIRVLLQQVYKECYRVLKPDRWFVTFYPTARLEEGKGALENAGFKFDPVPCIWYKPNKFLSSLSNPYQKFSNQYETFFWAKKGEPQFHSIRTGNVFVHDTPESSDRLHPLQMPVALWKEILEVGSVTGEYVVEPFAGSGSAGVACLACERNYLGIELSGEYADRANTWLTEMSTGEFDASARVASETPPTPTEDPFENLKELEF